MYLFLRNITLGLENAFKFLNDISDFISDETYRK